MTLNELVAHNHPVTNGNGVYTWDASSGASTVSVLIEPTTNNTKPVNISVGNRGGGQAMDITNPYLALLPGRARAQHRRGRPNRAYKTEGQP